MAYVIDVEEPGRPLERYELEGDHFIGRAPYSTITIVSSTVTRRHAFIRQTPEGLTIRDNGSANGTFVNGEKIRAEVPFGRDDVVVIGPCTFRIAPEGRPVLARFEARSPEEAPLLTALARSPADDDLRQVYGDWLAANGYAHEAETLALERELARTGEGGRFRYRLRLHARHTDPAWRAVATSPAIENCNNRHCAERWHRLAPLGHDDSIRHCAICERDVHLALSRQSAGRHDGAGRRFALDLAVGRFGGSYREPPFIDVGAAPPRPALATGLPFFGLWTPPTQIRNVLAHLGLQRPEGRPNPDVHAADVPLLVRFPLQGDEPLSDFVQRIELDCAWTYRVEVDLDRILASAQVGLRIYFRRDADHIERWLEERFRSARAAADWTVYGQWLFRRSGDACELGWERDLPDWALPPASAAAALDFLRSLGDAMRAGRTFGELHDLAASPPPGSGIVVVGPTNGADFVLELAPSLPARDVRAAFGVIGEHWVELTETRRRGAEERTARIRLVTDSRP